MALSSHHLPSSIVLAFSGQGSQYSGMGQDCADHPYFQLAEDVFPFSLKEICLNENNKEKLSLTEYTQPAIVLYSLILFDQLNKYWKQVLPDSGSLENSTYCVLGHSVGEYSALAAVGCFDSLQHVLRAVHLRGKSMQAAVPLGKGSMVAIVKLEASLIQEACEKISAKTGLAVSIANHNSPQQSVISGHQEACKQVVNFLKEREQKFRAIPLKVSAPFHSPLMLEAYSPMDFFFQESPLLSNNISYIPNIDAKLYPKATDSSVITQNLLEQICGQVRWVESIRTLPKNSKIIEIGPGKVLTGLNSKIRPDINCYSLDSQGFEGLQEFILSDQRS